MKRTPRGTPVGVDDPLDVVDRCDWVTQDGRCRLALTQPERNPAFASTRARNGYACPHVDPEADWTDCEEFRSIDTARRCVRCGLEERPIAHDPEARALVEAHHVAYGEADGVEITVALCRWCHAKVHAGRARIDDEAEPDPAAEAALESRLAREQASSFESAATLRDDEEPSG